MNAHRRSPARPCHDTSTLSSCSPAMDFTGYRHSPATRPTTVMTASTDSKAPLPMQWVSSVAEEIRRSAPRPVHHAIPGRRRASRIGGVRYVGPDRPGSVRRRAMSPSTGAEHTGHDGAAAGAEAGQAAPEPAAVPPPKSWKEMRDWAAQLLHSRTGQDVAAWNRRVAETGLPDEQALRAWLDSRGVTGYGQALLVWERFGYPDFLTTEADDLIAGQYAGRPQLRPVLDAVLAALPAVGPATVQARKTLVSMVTPRRTFAVVQAATKSRVDLGLRLDQQSPGGRLLPARDLGAATVRIPLTRPEDVDAEVLGWLRRAYRENAAPPPARRPPRRPAPVLGQLTVVIDGFDLPGLTCAPEPGGQVHQNIHVALAGPRKDGRGRGENRPALVIPGNPWLATEPVPGDSPSARWEVPITVRRDADSLDFSGPYVRGDRTDRHLGLAWGDVPGDGTLRLFRGAKLRLVDIDPRLVEEALRLQHRLVVFNWFGDP